MFNRIECIFKGRCKSFVRREAVTWAEWHTGCIPAVSCSTFTLHGKLVVDRAGFRFGCLFHSSCTIMRGQHHPDVVKMDIHSVQIAVCSKDFWSMLWLHYAIFMCAASDSIRRPDLTAPKFKCGISWHFSAQMIIERLCGLWCRRGMSSITYSVTSLKLLTNGWLTH